MTGPQRTAWVTGGGSGIGRAIAVQLAATGHFVIVSGRRPDPLADTVRAITDAGGRAEARPVDVASDTSVAEVHQRIEQAHGGIDVFVSSAGTNVPNRWWSDLTIGDYTQVLNTNLASVARCVLQVLPGMRSRGGGQVIVVSSWAGWRYMSVAGAAYGSSKTALGVLVESLNDQEGRSGIRATHLVPAEVNTPIFLTRPVPPSQEDLDRMLQPGDIASVVGFLTSLPASVCINEMVVSSTQNRIYRQASAYPGPDPA